MPEARPVALVTGASRGMGAATAVALARHGHDVALSARTLTEGAEATAGSLETTAAAVVEAGARALEVPADLTDRDAVAGSADRVLEELGRCDVLCNIGVYQAPEAMNRLLLDTPIEALSLTLEADVVAPALLIQKLLPTMIRNGGGTIVNMTSGVVHLDPEGTAETNGWSLAYAAGKAGIDRFASVLNTEYGDRGVRVFNTDPGFVAYGEALESALARYPGIPVSPPEVIGAAIAWLVESDEADQLLRKRVYLPALCAQHRLLDGWEVEDTYKESRS